MFSIPLFFSHSKLSLLTLHPKPLLSPKDVGLFLIYFPEPLGSKAKEQELEAKLKEQAKELERHKVEQAKLKELEAEKAKELERQKMEQAKELQAKLKEQAKELERRDAALAAMKKQMEQQTLAQEQRLSEQYVVFPRSSSPWHFNPDDVELVTKNRKPVPLGDGSSANVYLAMYKGYQVAVKEIKQSIAANPKFQEIFKSEVELHFSLHQHPGICKVVGAWSTFDPKENIVPSIVLELLPLKFTDIISRPSSYNVTVAKMLDILLSLASVLSFLHEQKLGHNDVKPDNVMLTADLISKILDFGAAKDRRLASISLSRMSKTDVRGTVGFMVCTHACRAC